MLAAIQPIELPIKAYALTLAGVMTAAFVTGAVLNFEHARKTPGADPYARPAVEAVVTPEPLPLAAPIEKAPPAVLPVDDDSAAALVAQRERTRPFAVRHEPTYCVDQTKPDGTLLGRLCQPDPGGVRGSAVGAVPATGTIAR